MPTRRRWKRPRPNSPPPASSRLRCARAEGAAGSGRAGRACLRKGRKQRKGERQEHPSLGVRFRLRFRRLSRRGVCIGSKRKISPACGRRGTHTGGNGPTTCAGRPAVRGGEKGGVGGGED